MTTTGWARPPTPDERAAQLLAEERATTRDIRRAFVSAILGCFCWVIVGMALMGWAFHTTDKQTGQVASWRRRGVARYLMEAVVAWAAEAGVVRLVLSASVAARPLYEKMGFVGTREMSYTGPLACTGPWTGSHQRS